MKKKYKNEKKKNEKIYYINIVNKYYIMKKNIKIKMHYVN